uniref:Nuclear receptor n=1 Tax=Meloidogyne incognita TaxID=6306 RepID=A0A914MUU8_MELIC
MSDFYFFNNLNTQILEKGNINRTNNEFFVDKQKYNDNEEGTRGINEGLSKSENPSVPKNVKKKRAFPTNCTVCGHIASGYVFYNAMCCDGCKHFFRRCISNKNMFKCNNNGDCDVSKGSLKCKSCRFDKCILAGMNVMTLRGNNAEAFMETHTHIKNRLKYLILQGKAVKEHIEKNAFEEIHSNSVGEAPITIGQDTQIIEFLLLVDKKARQIRNSRVNVPDWHYGYPCNSLEILLTRTENLLATSQEYTNEKHLNVPETFSFILKNGPFLLRPSTLTEDLLLIVDFAKTLPFFNKMYLSDKICLLTSIAMPLVVLAERQFSCSKKCETVTLPCGISLFDCFSGEHYNGDLTVKKYVKRVFLDSMEPFTQLQLSDEEYVLIRALIYSHMVIEGLSQYGKQLLQIEAENYAKILITILQVCNK